MPIVATEIQFRLSGGAANADPLLSLGGAKSSVAAGTNIFDDVTAAQSSAGATEYRCIYVHNANASLTLLGAVVWIVSNTVNTTTDILIGLGASAIGGTETAVANESTAPGSVTFSNTATSLATGLTIGDIPTGSHKAIWFQRVVTAQATASTDSFTIRVQGNTAQ